MLPISGQALAAVAGAARRPIRADWSNDGGQSWVPVPTLVGAEVRPDRTAECRYSGTAALAGVPLGPSGVNSVVTQVRLWQGIKGPRMDVEWIPAGVYVVDRLTRTRHGAEVELLGREDAIRSADLPAPRMVGPDSAQALAEVLIGEALPGVPVAWRPGVTAGTPVPAFVIEEDRWGALSGGLDTSGVGTGIAAAMGAEVYADARGIPTFAPVPTLADPVVWRIPYGLALVQPAEQETSEGLVNLWAISGDGGDGGAAIGPVYVWDDDPGSLTYAGPDPVGDPLAPQREGLTGVRIRAARYASALITDIAQAQEVGRARLADSLGIQASLSFTSACNPALEAGDVVEVEVRPGEWQRHIIDSCPYQLGAASMSCTTRTTARRLAI
ncbi:phage tail protein [Streptomyces cyaneofuscatus]|uniref:phage tail protein n=1 Tax=Streptomyces cyaneofuscatus TaxID=66883 RepID=UPI00295318CF|nr:phage tail protein [Streptomyces cyaneofuscatus]WOP11832.1 phage tail protein [Streptomyces cyaneofuscatus]